MVEERPPGASVIAALVPIALVAGVVLAVRATWRWFRARITENSLILNETLPVHSKWWRDHAKVRGEILYVALGDSAAQGIGASRPDHSYVGLLARLIRDTTGRTVRVVNLSVSGATTSLAVQDQLPKLAKYRPDVMTVSIGANDIAKWDPEAFEQNLRTIFDAVPSHALVADLPFFYFPHNERRVAVANLILRRVAAERGLEVVRLHRETRVRGWRRIFTHFANDWFHPNDHGYQVWADAFRPAMLASLTARFPADDEVAPTATGRAVADAPGPVAAARVPTDVGGRT
ncbi:SGNH/GDSL hydrolase family protein [Agromyces kandeliae]|uniref:SGNH/GDSL hydrolase family protein n=1 Tax=Agromyces kandeliae TaxID=2666141 RepID=A0A6L5R3A9_9MICO|nr:SGNH/GDSL hydrolase family protein [Agromyces kandeliae]MRX44355.1 SGNH/GDSL hydrolase family protein [Agromyces kandeliae]